MGPELPGGLLMLGFGGMELLRKGETAKSVAPTTTDRGTSAAITVAYACAILATGTDLLPAIPLSRDLAWAGVAVGCAGFALRVWAMRVLGRFYTRRLVTTADQRVVDRGPYRFVRHPGYLGSLLIWTGASASSENLLSLVLVSVLLAIAYAYRIATEERMLLEALGQPYADYRARSWRLVPFIFVLGAG